MEPITIGILGVAAYAYFKGGMGAKVSDFVLTPTTDRLVIADTKPGDYATGKGVFTFKAKVTTDRFFELNPSGLLAFIARADLTQPNDMWGNGLLVGRLDFSAAMSGGVDYTNGVPKACPTTWAGPGGPRFYQEAVSDQWQDGVPYDIVVQSGTDSMGNGWIRYQLTMNGQLQYDSQQVPVISTSPGTSFVAVQLFGSQGSVSVSGASYSWAGS